MADRWDIAAEEFVARQRTGAALNTVQPDRDPEEAARARRLARYMRVPPPLAENNPLITKDAQLQINKETIAQYPWMASFLGDADNAALVPKGGLAGPGNIVDTLGRKPKSAPKHPDLIDPRLTGSSFFGRKVDTPPRVTGLLDTTSEDIGQTPTQSYEGPRVRRYSDGRPVEDIPQGGTAYTGNMVLDTGSIARHIFSASVGGLAKATGGAIRYGLDTVGASQDSAAGDVATDLTRAGDFLQSYYRPQTAPGYLGKAQEYTLDAASMVFDIATTAGILKLGRVANVGRGIAEFYGVSQGAQAYGKYRERGGSADEALSGALIEGGAEYLGEVGPAAVLGRAFGEDAVKGIVKEYIAKDLLGEELTTAVQYSADQLIANPDGNWNLKDLGTQLFDTAAVTLLGGGLIGVANHAQLRPIVRAAEDAKRMQDGILDHAMLEDVMATAEKDPLRTNAPDAFARLLQEGAQTTSVRNVYIPVEAIEKVLADETLPEDERAVLTLYQDQINDAQATRGDVVVPVGDFAARFTGTLWQKLGEEVRVRPDGMGAREAREKRDALVAELEALDKQAEKEADQQEGGEADRPEVTETRSRVDDSKRQVYALVKQQMLDAGRSEREAQTTAALAASRAETLASSRYGQYGSALEAWQAEGFTIAKGGRGKTGAKRSVAQRVLYRGTNNSDERIAGGIGEGLLFASDSEDVARLYGDNIEQIGVREGAKILKNGTPEFKKVTGRRGNDLFRSLRKGESLRDGANDAIAKARAAGYDAVDLGGEEGVAILNEAAFIRGTEQVEDVIESSVGDGTGRTVYQPAYHGSPHIFDQFSLDAIGTGEGAQAYGWGLYFAGKKEIANFYRATLSRDGSFQVIIDGKEKSFPNSVLAINEAVGLKDQASYVLQFALTEMQRGASAEAAEKATRDAYPHYPTDVLEEALGVFRSLNPRLESKGRLYEVDIPEDDEYLLWDKPLSEQPEKVKAALAKMKGEGKEPEEMSDDEMLAALGTLEQTFDSREKTGQGFYKELAAQRGGDRVASQQLHEAGIAGIKYLDGGSRADGDGSYNYVVFDASRVAIKSYEQGARGKTDWFGDGSTVVTLFAQADFSTMLHEMSHVFLEQEFRLAQNPNASDALKRDVETLKKWFAANGHPVGEDGVIPTEAHELFARTGERYFREGKAPSAELRDTFAQLRTWLRQVYQSVKALTAYGPAPINPDIREVMDRIIATTDAIDDNAIAPMSQEELGMTDAEYAAYLDSVKGTRDAAEDALLEKMMRAIRQRETQRIAEQRRNVRAELNEQFNAQPGVRALHLLRTGRWLGEPEREALPLKLNTGWLIDNYGEEVLDKLPKGFPPIHRGDGVVGDVVAEATGMSSGDALVQALLGLRAQQDALRASGDPRSLREVYVSRAVDEVMAQRHGDIALNDAQIREEAIAALNSERQGERLAVELRQLKKRQGRGGVVTPYQVLKKWAQDKIKQGRVSDVASKSALNRYVRGHNKARTAFEEALLKGDDAEAIRQKQAQMINHALLAEGKRAADELEAIIKRMKRYAEREAMASIDQDYMDRIHALLAGFSFRAESQKSIEERRGFQEWAARQAAEGNEVHVPPRLAVETRNWSEATVAELLDLNDAMQSLIHLGKHKQQLRDRQAARDLAETVDTLEAQILDVPEKALPESSIGRSNRPFTQQVREAEGVADVGRAILSSIFTEKRKATARQWAADLLRFEIFADLIDHTKLGTGLMNKVLITPATEAQNLFSSLTDEVINPILDALKQPKWRAKLDDHITLPFNVNVAMSEADPRLGKPMTVSRRQYIGMLANTGNLSNLAKMAGGERWVRDHDSMTELVAFRDQLIAQASAEDLRLVNAIWASVEKLWPHIVRVERAMSGVVPEKVVAMPYETPQGVYMTGGYWPVVWDGHRSQMGQKQMEDMDSEQTKMFGIATPVGHTITRTGAVAPMEYSIDLVLGSHVNKVVSRIAYAEYIRDALKVWNNKRVMGAVRLRFGDEYHEQGLKWLKDQIPSGAVTAQGAKSMDRFLNWLRVNMSFAVLGVSYSTMMSQTLGLTYSIALIGEGKPGIGEYYVGKGMTLVLKHMGTAQGGVVDHTRAAQDFVFARSEEMARRQHEVSQETAEAYRKLKEQDTKYRRAQAAAFVPIALMDLHAVSIPTWLGAYAKGIDHDGLTEEEAANYADKMVRLSQGSGRQKDLTQLQRGTAGQKFLAMFFTPGAVMFNQQWESLQNYRAAEGLKDKGKAVYPLFWMIVLSSMAGALMQGDWPDAGDDDETSLGEWAMWALRNSLYEVMFGYPVARDIANTTERLQRGEYSEYGSTPMTFAMQSLAQAGYAGYQIATREEGETAVEGKDIKKLAIALGVLTRFPGLQVGRTAGFWADVANGEAEPQDLGDYIYGSFVGKVPEPDKEPAE